MNEKELNKKLAEWIGWEEVTNTPFGMIGFDPLEKQGSILYKRSLPDFTQSLDACFKWLLLKLPRWELSYKYYLSGMVYIAKVWAKNGIWREGSTRTSPALALCLAIERLIDADIRT